MHANWIKQKRPVFGILSIIFPILGVFCGLFRAHYITGNGEGWAEVTAFVHCFVGSIVFGCISVVLSLLRSEKPRLLPLIGFVINIIPIVWFVFH